MNDRLNNQPDEEIEVIAEELETEHDLKVLNECWHISIHPRDVQSFNNTDPQSQIKNLDKTGKIKRIKVIKDDTPSFKEFKSEFCYLGFEIDFYCKITKDEIESHFNPLRDDYKIRILPPNSNISDYIELIEDLSDKNRRIGEILKEIGSLTDSELKEVLNMQSELANEDAQIGVQMPIGELLVQERMVHEPVLKAALQKQKSIRGKYME